MGLQMETWVLEGARNTDYECWVKAARKELINEFWPVEVHLVDGRLAGSILVGRGQS